MEFINGLTGKEKEFFKCLKKVTNDGYWGLSIQVFVQNPDIDTFHTLIKELKSQAQDDAVIMMDILNEQCFNNLLNL
jgi:hypothetical protein